MISNYSQSLARSVIPSLFSASSPAENPHVFVRPRVNELVFLQRRSNPEWRVFAKVMRTEQRVLPRSEPVVSWYVAPTVERKFGPEKDPVRTLSAVSIILCSLPYLPVAVQRGVYLSERVVSPRPPAQEAPQLGVVAKRDRLAFILVAKKVFEMPDLVEDFVVSALCNSEKAIATESVSP